MSTIPRGAHVGSGRSHGARSDANIDLGVTLEDGLGARILPKPNGCWDWIGAVSDMGYGRVTIRGSTDAVAHRMVYKILVGPIPKGMHLHHECENRLCVNPSHMLLLTPAEHSARHAEMRRQS